MSRNDELNALLRPYAVFLSPSFLDENISTVDPF